VSVFKLGNESTGERRTKSNPMRANHATTKPKPQQSDMSVSKSASAKMIAKTGTDDGEWEEF